jgi:hypothetical protein
MLAFVSYGFANDVVITKAGSKVQCKVLEFDGSHFSCEMPDGTKTRVAASKIGRINFDAEIEPEDTEPSESLVGRFYVSVAEGAAIYVNGKPVHNARWKSFSDEITLSQGDLVIAELGNVHGNPFFEIAFVSSDRSQIINFKANHFKELAPQPVSDIKKETFDKAKTRVRTIKTNAGPLVPEPIKSKSESVWGSGKRCLVAARITKDMIEPIPPTKDR